MYHALTQLVQRSLLGYNQRTDRYQFHRLIREFFLDIQRSMEGVKGNEVKWFSFSFRWYYTQILGILTWQFTAYVGALAMLDIERHNIYHFLHEISKCNDEQQYSSSLKVIASTLRVGFLNCRFTTKELVKLTHGFIKRLNQMLISLFKEQIPHMNQLYPSNCMCHLNMP